MASLLNFTPIRELRSAFYSYELLALQAKVNKGGLCNGIVMWIDWILDPSASLVISTGPKGIESGPVDMCTAEDVIYNPNVILGGILRHIDVREASKQD